MSNPRPASPAREQIAAASKPVLARIHALPRWVPPVVTLVLVAVGTFGPVALAVPALLLVLVFLAWITYLAWPIVPASGRAIRVVMFLLIIGIGISRLL